MKTLSALITSISVLPLLSLASIPTDFDLKESLEAFHQSPKDFYNSPTPKFSSSGKALEARDLIEPQNPIFQQRQGCRQELTENENLQRPLPVEISVEEAGSYAAVTRFLNSSNFISNLQEMEERKLTSKVYAGDMWSGWYWPISVGSLGVRYREPEVPPLFEWIDIFKFHKDNPVEDVLAAHPEKIDTISPSEKYEILIGDDSHMLTFGEWNQGKQYYDHTGSVESWMGLCHGWAPASYRMPRPKKKVSAKAANGEIITFYPDDLKALGTHLWAKDKFENGFMGGRCNDKQPEVDEMGRPTDKKCFDVNPGNWHIALVTKMGDRGETLIIDASYDYEVWNHPVKEYEYTYFNPITREPVDNWKEARAKIADHKEDPFKKYRSKDAKYLVGVQMKIRYLIETEPTRREFDGPMHDLYSTAIYLYDLEIDAKGEILGGEWYKKTHPDFIWAPRKWSKPQDYIEEKFKWRNNQALPEMWQEAAQEFTKYGRTLGPIVEKLFDIAK